MSRYWVSQNGLTLLCRLTPELPATTSASTSCSAISPRASAKRRSISPSENLTRGGAAPTPAVARATGSPARRRPRSARAGSARRRTAGSRPAHPTAPAATARTVRRSPTARRSYEVGEPARRLRLHLRQLRRVLHRVQHLAGHDDGAVGLDVDFAVAVVGVGEHLLLLLDRPAVLLDHLRRAGDDRLDERPVGAARPHRPDPAGRVPPPDEVAVVDRRDRLV